MKRLLSALLAACLAACLLPAVACAATDSYTEKNATLIAFTNKGATGAGLYGGYEIDGAAVSITEAGTYVLSGACADGSITVKKAVKDVTLVLGGLDLTSESTAALTLNKDSAATVLAAAGTDNTLADSAATNEEKAAIKVKSGASLMLSGTGTLHVAGNFKNGVKGAAESAITVDELTLDIEAADDGLSCDDALTIRGGDLTITAGGDAIKASPDTTDETAPDTVSKGDITITGGTLRLNATGDGVQADGSLTITGGTFDVTTNGGYQTTLSDTDGSCKGFKAAGALSLTGGVFTVDTADDAFHSNDVLYVTGGSYTITTGDDAFHADNTLAIGTEGSSSTATPHIDIAACYEGLEGAKIYLYSGNIDLTAADDGVNAANGDYGRVQNAFALYILGGELTIDAGGDGLDSNGDIVMTGGTVEVFGAASGGDGALDYDGAFTQTGGTLLAVGMSQMAQAPTASAGTQDYVAFGQLSQMGGGMGGHGGMGGGQRPENSTQEGGTPPSGENGERPSPPAEGAPMDDETGTRPEKGRMGTRPESGMGDAGEAAASALGITKGSALVIKNGAGETLYNTEARKTADSVVFCSPAVAGGETYTLVVDGAEAASAEATEATGTGDADTSFSLSEAGFDETGNDDAAAAQPVRDWLGAAVRYAASSGLMNSALWQWLAALF
ncbi:carbohydrate-binding domain-containing protein [Butyricicoccus faecihominis]|uniref:carbohydrate-binding domain-containing protein n=1 Tax=Butyricicoccus faecihominis TaxID=1712515 RepID=UPI00247A3A63|nr:carbohydrate-binding domain-containing protein [Butyricicoccus faecihominis]MCQ5130781.1 carbohydrate-binding domain-containing protein [Butyricicoccus faecihominis]